MKKIIIIIGCFFIMISNINAQCSYKDQINLNKLSGYVDYSYEYMNDAFNVKLVNVVDELYLQHLFINYNPVNKEVYLSGIKEGETLKVTVYSSINSNCPNIRLRVMTINLPYVNEFYKSEECTNHMDLLICNSRFLSYKLDYITFSKILNKQIEQKKEIEKNNEEKEEEINSIWDNIIDFAKEYWIPFTLVIGSAGITYFIGNIIYNRIRYKL